MAEQPQQPPPPADRPTDPATRVALIAAALAAGAGTAAGATAAAGLTAAALAAVTKLLVRWRYDRRTIRYTLRVMTRVLRTAGSGAVDPVPGPASQANARVERVFTSWFIERSTDRVEAAYAAGAEDGVPEAREERFIQQHLDAQQRRREAARKVDQEAGKPGQVTDRPAGADGVPGDPDGLMDGTRPRVILLWRAHPDDKVTPECRAADGAWFYADTPPVIGYPGMPHGGTCRCWSANAGTLAAVARGRHVNEAVRGIIAENADHRTHPGATLPPNRQTA